MSWSPCALVPVFTVEGSQTLVEFSFLAREALGYVNVQLYEKAAASMSAKIGVVCVKFSKKEIKVRVEKKG